MANLSNKSLHEYPIVFLFIGIRITINEIPLLFPLPKVHLFVYINEKGVGIIAYYSALALDCPTEIISKPTPKDMIVSTLR